MFCNQLPFCWCVLTIQKGKLWPSQQQKNEPLAKPRWKVHGSMFVVLKMHFREDAPQLDSLLLFDDALMRSTSSSSSSSRIQEPQSSLFPSVNGQCAPLACHSALPCRVMSTLLICVHLLFIIMCDHILSRSLKCTQVQSA